MRFTDRLQNYENQYMFIRWAMGEAYGKLNCVGEDFIEFDVIDVENNSTFKETILVHMPLVLEISIGGADVARVIAEVSANMKQDS